MSMPDLIKIVSGFAPVLGSLLGGPIGGGVGALIASLFGGSKDDPADLVRRIQADPDAAVKLKKLEYDHLEELKNIQADREKTQADDRKDARARELELAKMGMQDKMPHIIAFMIIGAVIGVVMAQLIPGVNTSNSALLGQISGMLTREIIQICAYYFGGDSQGDK
ncbi:MAG TPA: hypothetical protein VGW78_07715 [Candidatus Babeliales bacterium]|jgi:hypothetical protein|nr:hypothetical protein [Candidatus Babeliales bacterium]